MQRQRDATDLMNDVSYDAPPVGDADLWAGVDALRHEVAAPIEPLPDDVHAERLREERLAEEELRQQEVEGRPPAEAEPRP